MCLQMFPASGQEKKAKTTDVGRLGSFRIFLSVLDSSLEFQALFMNSLARNPLARRQAAKPSLHMMHAFASSAKCLASCSGHTLLAVITSPGQIRNLELAPRLDCAPHCL